MQSGGSQEALTLCSVNCLKEKHDKQLPSMSAPLIQISIDAGKHMIIMVG